MILLDCQWLPRAEKYIKIRMQVTALVCMVYGYVCRDFIIVIIAETQHLALKNYNYAEAADPVSAWRFSEFTSYCTVTRIILAMVI